MAKKLTRAEKIRRYLKANPDTPVKDVAARFGTSYQIVYMVKKDMSKKIALTATEAKLANKAGVSTAEYAKQRAKIERNKSAALPVPEARAGYEYRWVNTNALSEEHKDELAAQLITMEEPVSDPVNHPAHYKTGGIETIDFIEAKGLNYNMGNAIKYISRADHKGNKKQDLEKAVWYLNRELSRV